MTKKQILTIIAAVAAASPLFAKITTSALFSDNMMLQRDAPVKIWGTSLPDAVVDAEFAGQKKSANADAKGNWKIVLDKMPADKTPRTITIFENGKADKKIANVIVGDIWVLGGQSNMEWRLKPTSDGDAAVARSNYPQIRYFSQKLDVAETPQKNPPAGAKWLVSSPEVSAGFSAIGFYFAEKLSKDLDVPVGMLYAARGASKMLCWIPEERFANLPYLAKELADFKEAKRVYDYKKALDAHKLKLAEAAAEDAKLKAEGKPAKKRTWSFKLPPCKISPFYDFSTPSYLYNAMVAPFSGFAVKGTIWYQGESDTGKKSASNYEPQFSILIDSWRAVFENPKMPFLWVTLASYSGSENWSRACRAQLETSLSVPNTACANIIDCGEKSQIHPQDKTTPALRLERLALNTAYGDKSFDARSPRVLKCKILGDSAKLEFFAPNGLVGKGEPRGFEVLSNGKWVCAAPKLDGKTVVVKSPDGSKIEAVRYLWKAWARPDVWLFDSNGLPAFNFNSVK